MNDTSAQLTPTGFDADSAITLTSSANEWIIDKHMDANPNAVLNLINPTDSYRDKHIQRRMPDISTREADQHIDFSTRNYRELVKHPDHSVSGMSVTHNLLPEQTSTLIKPSQCRVIGRL